MARRRADRGLTLLEILLSLIVLVLGVLGILALFPPALQSSAESIEDTHAAILAESVAHALTNAVKHGVYDPATQQHRAVLTHDLSAGTTQTKYQFTLPKIADGWKHYPSAVPPPQDDPGGPKVAADQMEASELLFNLGSDGWVKATVENVQRINDTSDAYAQYAFSFDMRKLDSHLEYLLNYPKEGGAGGNYTPDDLEKMSRLYEVRIHIFRVSKQMSTFGGSGTQSGGAGAGTDVRKLVATLTKKISY